MDQFLTCCSNANTHRRFSINSVPVDLRDKATRRRLSRRMKTTEDLCSCTFLFFSFLFFSFFSFVLCFCIARRKYGTSYSPRGKKKKVTRLAVITRNSRSSEMWYTPSMIDILVYTHTCETLLDKLHTMLITRSKRTKYVRGGKPAFRCETPSLNSAP